jgi:hypothetical protein
VIPPHPHVTVTDAKGDRAAQATRPSRMRVMCGGKCTTNPPIAPNLKGRHRRAQVISPGGVTLVATTLGAIFRFQVQRGAIERTPSACVRTMAAVR